MKHGSKLLIGWIAVIQLLLSLFFAATMLLASWSPADAVTTWLGSEAGQWFTLASCAYCALVALCTWLIILFVPTTTKTLTLTQDRSHKLTISKKGVEHSLTAMLSREYPQLANAESSVKLRRRKQDAIITISATVVEPVDMTTLGQRISADAEHNLGTILGISVRKVKVRLRPYQPGETIDVT